MMESPDKELRELTRRVEALEAGGMVPEVVNVVEASIAERKLYGPPTRNGGMDGGTWQRFLRSVDVLLTTYPDGSWRTAQPPQDFRLTEEEIVAVLEESEHYQRMGQITTFASVKSDLEKALAAKRERLERGEA